MPPNRADKRDNIIFAHACQQVFHRKISVKVGTVPFFALGMNSKYIILRIQQEEIPALIELLRSNNMNDDPVESQWPLYFKVMEDERLIGCFAVVPRTGYAEVKSLLVVKERRSWNLMNRIGNAITAEELGLNLLCAAVKTDRDNPAVLLYHLECLSRLNGTACGGQVLDGMVDAGIFRCRQGRQGYGTGDFAAGDARSHEVVPRPEGRHKSESLERSGIRERASRRRICPMCSSSSTRRRSPVRGITAGPGSGWPSAGKSSSATAAGFGRKASRARGRRSGSRCRLRGIEWALRHEKNSPRGAANVRDMVDLSGFEPLTSSLPAKRSPN